MKLLKFITFVTIILSATILPAQKKTNAVVIPPTVKHVKADSVSMNKKVDVFVVPSLKI